MGRFIKHRMGQTKKQRVDEKSKNKTPTIDVPRWNDKQIHNWIYGDLVTQLTNRSRSESSQPETAESVLFQSMTPDEILDYLEGKGPLLDIKDREAYMPAGFVVSDDQSPVDLDMELASYEPYEGE
jgi:hypothetical protein